MAIAFDSTANGNSAGTSTTFSHTCSGSDRGLFVGVLTDGTVTGVTYAGVAMALVNSVLGTPTGNNEYLYYLSAPATGANNVIATASGSGSVFGHSMSYTGVLQSGQPEAQNTNTAASGTSLTVSLTTIADNAWLVGYFRNGATSLSAGAGTTLRSASSSIVVADSGGAKTPPGTHSLEVTAASGQYAGLIASIAPSLPNVIMTAAQGAFTLTGQDAILRVGVSMIASAGSYILTGFDALFNRTGWVLRSKSSTTFTNQTKSSSTFNNQSKSNSTWTNKTK
jgi:hypothetical protein